jgi:hypothetical protein
MSVQHCTRGGKPGYRAISPRGAGDCFLYRTGDPGGRERAKVSAQKQLTAMAATSKGEDIQAVLDAITCG